MDLPRMFLHAHLVFPGNETTRIFLISIEFLAPRQSNKNSICGRTDVAGLQLLLDSRSACIGRIARGQELACIAFG